MQIETLIKLLQKQNKQANAWVKEYSGKRKNKVSIVFNADSKVYDYTGTILQVAERLNLIPELDVDLESQKVIDALLSGVKEVVSFARCSDTIRHRINTNLYLDDKPVENDEFGRQQVIYFLTDDNGGW